MFPKMFSKKVSQNVSTFKPQVKSIVQRILNYFSRQLDGSPISEGPYPIRSNGIVKHQVTKNSSTDQMYVGCFKKQFRVLQIFRKIYSETSMDKKPKIHKIFLSDFSCKVSIPHMFETNFLCYPHTTQIYSRHCGHNENSSIIHN